MPGKYVRDESKNGRMGAMMIAIVAEGEHGRIYLPANDEHIKTANIDKPEWYPTEEMNQKSPDLLSGRGYGVTHWHQLFTNRQLTALTTFSDLIPTVQEQVIADGGSKGYSEAVAVYLAFLIDKLADRNSSICSWDTSRDGLRNTFGRQAIPMVWDFAEANPFSNSSGCFDNMLEWVEKSVQIVPAKIEGKVFQHNASSYSELKGIVISTDPPYYDNIGYADLSDFFYIWLRHNLKNIYPEIFSTMLVPKKEELIATPYRFDGNKQAAKDFFENGMAEVCKQIHNSTFPSKKYV